MNHFTLEEFRCHSGVPYPQNYVDDGTWARNLATGNVLREAWGSELTVLSGYRDPWYNARLRKDSIARLVASGRTPAQAERETGVAKTSQHMYGTAADVQPTHDPKATAQLGKLFLKLIKADKLPFLGGYRIYPSWIHYDVRPRGPAGGIVSW